MSKVTDYWDNQWSVVATNKEFEEYSQSIPQDFLQAITSPRETLTVIKNARTVYDYGSGTGHLCHVISLLNWGVVTGKEISSYVVDYANNKYGNGRVNFTLDENMGDYDLIVTSNTLEHFKNPNVLICEFIKHCKHLLIMVPFKGTISETEDGGGAGHAYSFSLNDFYAYNYMESFVFESRGWTELPDPKQFVVLLKGEL
jgi:SAM-dependent methyltransferase